MSDFDAAEMLHIAFPDVDIDILRDVAQLAKTGEYPAGTVLCREGDKGDTFYIIRDGEIEITKAMANGEERILRNGTAGDFFGEMAALLPETVRSATVTTLTRVQTIELDHTTFQNAIMHNPQMAFTLIRTMMERMQANDAATIRDLSSQKEMLEHAYEELRRQEKQRDQFMDTLAHELRTPLTGAKGYLQLIKAGIVQGALLDDAIGKINFSFNRIISLVNDLLFMQEMELLDFGYYRVDVRQILAELKGELGNVAREQNCSILLDFPEDIPAILGDSDGLTRAFKHLLDNAIKFSPAGGQIIIAVRSKPNYLEIDFMDQGVGIPPEFMPRLFKRFERMETFQGYLFGGVGVGLPIVKHIIDSHEGTISVTSTPGKGSTFHVRLPIDARRSTVELRAAREEWVDTDDLEATLDNPEN